MAKVRKILRAFFVCSRLALTMLKYVTQFVCCMRDFISGQHTHIFQYSIHHPAAAIQVNVLRAQWLIIMCMEECRCED